MKKLFGCIVVLAVILLSSCSQNAGLSGGNVKPGSSSDPFVNSSWYLHAGSTSIKMIDFLSGGKFIYGAAFESVGGVEMKGNYSIQKNGNGYVANCVISYGGESGTLKLELDSFNSTSGILRLDSVYYNVYSY